MYRARSSSVIHSVSVASAARHGTAARTWVWVRVWAWVGWERIMGAQLAAGPDAAHALSFFFPSILFSIFYLFPSYFILFPLISFLFYLVVGAKK